MEKFLVCLDTSPRAEYVLDTARRVAALTKAKLVLYRSVGIPPELPPDLFQSGDSLEDILVGRAKADLVDRAKGVPPEILGGCVVHVATPWDGICRAAKEEEVDLIIVGSHGYGALDRLLGTTAAKVVNHADRSVLVVRPRG